MNKPTRYSFFLAKHIAMFSSELEQEIARLIERVYVSENVLMAFQDYSSRSDKSFIDERSLIQILVSDHQKEKDRIIKIKDYIKILQDSGQLIICQDKLIPITEAKPVLEKLKILRNKTAGKGQSGSEQDRLNQQKVSILIGELEKKLENLEQKEVLAEVEDVVVDFAGEPSGAGQVEVGKQVLSVLRNIPLTKEEIVASLEGWKITPKQVTEYIYNGGEIYLDEGGGYYFLKEEASLVKQLLNILVLPASQLNRYPYEKMLGHLSLHNLNRLLRELNSVEQEKQKALAKQNEYFEKGKTGWVMLRIQEEEAKLEDLKRGLAQLKAQSEYLQGLVNSKEKAERRISLFEMPLERLKEIVEVAEKEYKVLEDDNIMTKKVWNDKLPFNAKNNTGKEKKLEEQKLLIAEYKSIIIEREEQLRIEVQRAAVKAKLEEDMAIAQAEQEAKLQEQAAQQSETPDQNPGQEQEPNQEETTAIPQEMKNDLAELEEISLSIDREIKEIEKPRLFVAEQPVPVMPIPVKAEAKKPKLDPRSKEAQVLEISRDYSLYSRGIHKGSIIDEIK